MGIQSIASISLYMLASFLLAINLFNIIDKTRGKDAFIFFVGVFALTLHAQILHQSIFLYSGFDFSFFNVISIIGWLVALIVLVTSIYQPIQQLLLVLYPIAATTILLEQFFPAQKIIDQSLSTGLRIHILLSICAYSLLMIGTFQALLLLIQDWFLKTKQVSKIIDVLPPLQIMEKLLIQIILVGFFLLSLSLTTGIVFVYDIFEQHLAHKTILSVLAWIIYAVLLWGRWSFGWRGKRIINWVLGGFITLLLAYTGSKFALEFVFT
tara:strand:- start:261 stop:1061 length:801 start_codon:yes stop_codon:yes gene_type:complete